MYVSESLSLVLLMVRLRLTEEIFPPAVGTGSGSEGLLRLMRESTLSFRTAPFLIQVTSGGGIPVAEQVKVTGSSSLTVYVKPSSTGKVMLGMTGGDSNGHRSHRSLRYKTLERITYHAQSVQQLQYPDQQH